MINLLRMEVKKSIYSSAFFLSILLMVVLTVSSAIYVVYTYEEYVNFLQPLSSNGIFDKNYILQTYTAYSGWIGGESRSFAQGLFYLLLPALSVIPYGVSYYQEQHIGYMNNVYIRTSKIKYLMAKSFAAFFSGFMACFISLIFNLIIVFLILPNAMPHVNYSIYYLVYFGHFLSDFFYSIPFIYLLSFVILTSTFSGLFSFFTISLSFTIKNKYILYAFSMIVLAILEYGAIFIDNTVVGNQWPHEISLINLLHACTTRGDKNGLIILMYFCTLLFLAVLMLFFECRRKDDY